MLLSILNKVPYDISASVPASFEIPFKYFTKSEIIAEISLDQTARPGEGSITLVQGVDYTLTDPGETGTAYRENTWDADAISLTIYRIVDLEQGTNLQNGDLYNADNVERMVDYCMAAIQQVNEKFSRCIYAPITDGDADLKLPTKEELKTHSIAWDATGENIIVSDKTVANCTPFIETLLDDSTPEAARTTLDVYGKSETLTQAETEAYVDVNVNQGVKTSDSPEFINLTTEKIMTDEILADEILSEKIIVDGVTFRKKPIEILGSIGNDFSVGTLDFPEITRLDETHIAFFDNTVERLETYEWDGTDWAKVGNTFTITGAGLGNLTALSSTRVAFGDIATHKLGTYDWDGTDWSLVGSLFTLPGGDVRLCALTSSRIAILDTGSGLMTYDFDGTNWSQTGNTLAVTTCRAMSAIDSTHIFYMHVNTGFKVYEWDGSDWSLVTGPHGTAGSSGHMDTLTPFDFIFIDDTNNTLELHHWDVDRNIIEQVDSYALTSTNAGICRLGNDTFALVNDSGEKLITYKLRWELSS